MFTIYNKITTSILYLILFYLIYRQTYGKNMKKNWNDIETNLLIWIIVIACSWKKLDCRKIVFFYILNLNFIYKILKL